MNETTLQSLPWPWFEFDEPPHPLDPADPPPTQELPSVENAGATRVYAIRFHDRLIPFKFFRQHSPTPRPLLILQHGMGLTIATFRAIAPYLFHSHDLALIDYSSLTLPPQSAGWPLGGVPIRALAESVWPIADALRAKTFSIAGNSLGGGLCLITALHPNAQQKSRLTKILLSNPACYPQKLPTMYRLARVPLLGELLMSITPAEKLVAGVEYISYVDKSRFDPDLKARYIRHLSHRHNRFRIMDMMRHLPANEKDLAPALHLPRLHEITQPTLLTWGEQDPLLTQNAGERLARELPHCTFDPHPDLAHMPHEEAPDRIGPRWAEFLNK
ncbi:MAG TPA: alpha/beta hydrolase [Phycisphaerae bacterium]|nr:alpha/beta hydrolase [Phycisphaerae bacterium]